MRCAAIVAAVLAGTTAASGAYRWPEFEEPIAADEHCVLAPAMHSSSDHWASGIDITISQPQIKGGLLLMDIFNNNIQARGQANMWKQQLCSTNPNSSIEDVSIELKSRSRIKSKLPIIDFLVGPGYFDSRVQSWPLMSWPSAAAITVVYIVGVYAGKQLMTGRRAFNMSCVSALHNAFMFCLNFYMVIEMVSQGSVNFGWTDHLQLWGNPIESGMHFSPSGYRLARIFWIDYLAKAYEFVDTLIMILRKSERQITFLHVYHHATVFFPCAWAAVNFNPGGDLYFACALNCAVHVLMYGYYLLTSLGYKAPKIVRKSITLAQMVQFAFIFCQAFYDLFWVTWYRPRIVMILELMQSMVFMFLFHRFMSCLHYLTAIILRGRRRAYSDGKNKGARAISMPESSHQALQDE